MGDADVDHYCSIAPRQWRPSRLTDAPPPLPACSDALSSDFLFPTCHGALPFKREATPKAVPQALHNSRPAPRHRNAVDTPGSGPMAPRGTTPRTAHRIFPFARAIAIGLGILGERRGRRAALPKIMFLCVRTNLAVPTSARCIHMYSYSLVTNVVVERFLEKLVGVGRLVEQPTCLFRGQPLGGRLLHLLIRMNIEDA